MRIECHVAFGVRTPTNPCKTGKASRSFVGLGRVKQAIKELPDRYSMVVRSRVRDSERIEVSPDNVQRIHRTQLSSGKATIEFSTPAWLIFISEADPRQLEGFLLTIDAILAVKRLSGLPTLADVERECDPSKFDSRPLKMVIESQSAYPRGVDPFPNSLLHLTISDVGLRAVDKRWFGLRRLTSLDLSNNSLGKMKDEEWSKFDGIRRLGNLTHLNLSGNGLSHIPDEFYQALPVSLISLDLSDNDLEELPEEISRLVNLQHLSLRMNPLRKLPEDLCLLRSLRVLDVWTNNPAFENRHPSVLFQVRARFERLELPDSSPPQTQLCSGVPPLASIASAAALNNFRSEELREYLPRVIYMRMRDSCRRCHFCLKLVPACEANRSKEWIADASPWRSAVGPTEYSGPRMLYVEKFVCHVCRPFDS